MSNSNSVSDIEDSYKNKFAASCSGTVDEVSITALGTLRIDVFDANMADLDVIDEEIGVGSVERRGGCLQVTSEKQVAPCSVVR